MLNHTRQNTHKTQIPAPGQIGYLTAGYDTYLGPLYYQGKRQRYQITAYPLTDSADPRYSIGIHTIHARRLADGETIQISARHFRPEEEHEDVNAGWRQRHHDDTRRRRQEQRQEGAARAAENRDAAIRWWAEQTPPVTVPSWKTDDPTRPAPSAAERRRSRRRKKTRRQRAARRNRSAA